MPDVHDMNVAFKVTWVYGEDGPWTSPCTPEGRRTNILNAKKTWCSQEDCPCHRLLNTEEHMPHDAWHCYDYPVFQRWSFGAGVYHHGDREGSEIPMHRAGEGKFAILTSRPHGTHEEDRLIIGCYRIDRVGYNEDFGLFEVSAAPDSPYALRVPNERLDDAPRYWEFRPESVERRWGSGLFRYIPDDEADRMRLAVASLCEGVDTTVWQDVESIRQEEEYLEGQRSTRLTSYCERNPKLRSDTISIHGTKCQVCGFDFEQVYGTHGEGYVEVHHLRPLASYEGPVVVNPETDMAVVCSNCHRMVHRRPKAPLTLEELRRMLRKR